MENGFWKAFPLLLIILSACSTQPSVVSGVVSDEYGPLGGAVVRIQTTELFVLTNEDGSFVFNDLQPETPVKITAWKSGYYISGGEKTYQFGETEIELMLIRHTDSDHPGYEWLSAFSSSGDPENCQNCHAQPNDPASALPFDEWILDAHAQSTNNERFLTMYAGTDIHGNQSPPTRKGYNRDYGSFPLPPDPSLPYFGPGYKTDFPDTAGNCSACHAPMQAISAPYGIDPSSVAERVEGISCDFCHKIWAVNLDQEGLPLPNMPGVLSYQFRRPGGEHQLFMGPLDDVAPGEDTFSPLQNQSEFCAPCHTAVFWDTPIYNSFGEWLESPYSDPISGQTCQDCHMPTGLTDHFALIDEGGLARDPRTIFSHRMPGATSVDLLTNAVSVSVKGWKEEGVANVQVEITNDQTGHHVPTDSPFRHLILVIKARTESNETLELVEGSVIPDWAGIGDPDDGRYGGQPGKIYAKVLTELWTEVSPSGNYWNPTLIVSDNRIAAYETDITNFQFIDPEEGKLTIDVKLIYRRAFIELMDQKSWDVPDIMMAEEIIILE
ncbi:MAG: hypothetical protein KAH12_01845 [Anaerolineales bacterium]|nr:hypothetical protein [Anaerolineales bacterium]